MVVKNRRAADDSKKTLYLGPLSRPSQYRDMCLLIIVWDIFGRIIRYGRGL